MSRNDSWLTLSNLVHGTMKKLEKKGVTQAEAFFTSTQTTEVAVRNSEIFAQNRVTDAGVGFRVVVDRDRVGFASTNALNEPAVLETGVKAISIAKASSHVSNFAFPDTNSTKNVSGLFDPRVAEMSVEEAVEVAKRAVDAAESFDKRITAKDGRVSYISGWRGVANTLGVEREEQETRAYVYLGGNGRQNGEVTSGCMDFMFKRRANLNPEIVGENMARMVIALFKARSIASFEGAVIFGPEAVSYQLFDVLAEALNGSNVASGRSPWSGKIDEQVASDKVTAMDNAVLGGGFASRSFDDEGYPSQVTVLIDRGKLKSFLHHAATAKALKTEDTGNACRYPGRTEMVRMITGNGYRTQPEVYPSNLMIERGSKSKEEMVSEMDKGVLVESMAGFAQQGSGQISAQLSRGFWVKNGEVQHAIKGGMVSGVAFDWLNQVSTVGSDSKQFLNSIVPSVLVENVKVVCA
jgi:PmbA protein